MNPDLKTQLAARARDVHRVLLELALKYEQPLHPAWASFDAFNADMGDPPSLSARLVRVVEGLGWVPWNVIWFTGADDDLGAFLRALRDAIFQRREAA